MSLPAVVHKRIRFERQIVPLLGRSFSRVSFSLLLLLVTPLATAQEQHQANWLEPDKPIERELAGGQTHTYRVNLTTGQFLRVMVERRGINVVAAIVTPEGSRLAELASVSDAYWLEAVSAIATTTGSHLIEIKSLNKNAAGRYEVKIADLRAATDGDRTHVTAQETYAEAVRLYKQNNPEARKPAIAKFDEARELWQNAGSELEVVAAKRWLAAHYLSTRNYQPAVELYQQIAAFWQALGKRKLEAESLLELGGSYQMLRDNPKSLDHFNRALTIFQSLGDGNASARANTRLEMVYTALGEYQKAAGASSGAFQHWRAVGNRKLEAESLLRLGVNYRELREFQKSLEHFNQALTIFQSLEDRDAIARVSWELGGAYILMGKPLRGIEAHEISLQQVRALGNNQRVHFMLMRIGGEYRTLNDDQKTLEYYEQALALAREMKDRSLEANSLNMLGVMYAALQTYAKATDYCNQALQIYRETGYKFGEADILQYLAKLSMREYELGEPIQQLRWWRTRSSKTAQAFAQFNQSRALFREINSPYEARPLAELALYYAATGDRRTALEYCERALQLNEKARDIPALIRVGDVYTEYGEPQKDLELNQEAYRLVSSYGYSDAKAEVAWSLADKLIAVGRLAEAKSLLEETINLKESFRPNLADEDLRTTFTAQLARSYEYYADLLMQMHGGQLSGGLDVLAFQASERARARSLLDKMNEARVNIRQDVDPALLERESALQLKLNSLGERGANQTEAVRKELEVTLDELRRVRAQIKQASPRYAELTQPQPPSLKEIQTELLDASTMLLAYSLGNKRSFLWTITPDSFTTYQLPPRAEIDKAARSLYDLLTIRQRLNGLPLAQQQKQIAEADAQYWAEAMALSQMLLAPVAAQLGKKRLLIIAPEALQYLPFAALPDPAASGNRQPLLVNHEVIALPSISVLMLLRREAAGRQAASKGVAVLADPVFATDDPRVRKVNPANRNVARNHMKTPAQAETSTVALPAALARSLRSFNGTAEPKLPRLLLSRDEANAIVAAAPQRDGLEALDFKASRTVAMSSELSQYRIVHFATHGLLNAQHPELSGLVFSLVDEAGQPQDGFLRLHEIYNLKLPAELVVLSACQTALGKEIKGEGLVGLTRGFMHAGVPRVVASLWRVDDYATSVLMKRFYRVMLQEKLRPAEALRQAQLEMWRQKQWQAPFYWGAFVLQGEWK